MAGKKPLLNEKTLKKETSLLKSKSSSLAQLSDAGKKELSVKVQNYFHENQQTQNS